MNKKAQKLESDLETVDISPHGYFEALGFLLHGTGYSFKKALKKEPYRFSINQLHSFFLTDKTLTFFVQHQSLDTVTVKASRHELLISQLIETKVPRTKGTTWDLLRAIRSQSQSTLVLSLLNPIITFLVLAYLPVLITLESRFFGGYCLGFLSIIWVYGCLALPLLNFWLHNKVLKYFNVEFRTTSKKNTHILMHFIVLFLALYVLAPTLLKMNPKQLWNNQEKIYAAGNTCITDLKR